jgi:hypothetical protein
MTISEEAEYRERHHDRLVAERDQLLEALEATSRSLHADRRDLWKGQMHAGDWSECRDAGCPPARAAIEKARRRDSLPQAP